MVMITLHNIEGFYTGVLADMAANLSTPVNDNGQAQCWKNTKKYEDALTIMSDMMNGDDSIASMFDKPDCDVNDIVRRIENRMDKYEKALHEIEMLMASQDQ